MSIDDSDACRSKDLQAPAAAEFAEFPASWYRLCSSDMVKPGPFARKVFDRRLVAYRRKSGEVVVMDAICGHLGADLGLGAVTDDCLECPFHGWKYGSDGRCREVPSCTTPPEFAAQRIFPCQERHGSIYFFNGAKPTFPLPFFMDEDPQGYRSIAPRRFEAPCTWYMVNAHAFDVQHFESVHGRRLVEPLKVDVPAPFARRSRYLAEVLNNNLHSLLLQRLVSDRVTITLTIWGGTFAVVTGDFGRSRSRFFVISEPTSEGHTMCDVAVFTPQISNPVIGPILAPLMLRIRRWLTTGYLQHERAGLGTPRYNPHSLIEADQEMVRYFQWAAQLK
ncbi:MAG: Rieske (2Fe-2S) protein [Rubripirellula sp.]|nr:Rieske (2Fe-2S) protein [Rubripirellula sp.]